MSTEKTRLLSRSLSKLEIEEMLRETSSTPPPIVSSTGSPLAARGIGNVT